MEEIAQDDDDLFLVDCGIESLSEVYLNLPNLKSLNLHSNYIMKIENLSALRSLTTLDLSSNQITRMEALSYLTSLKRLNLSCNLLTIVEGLTNLSNLTTLNLSYNQVANLSGLKRLPSNNNLRTLQLHGNNLTDMNHVLVCLRSCPHLFCLVLDDGKSATNPLCSYNNYKSILSNQLPSLSCMDKPLEDDSSDLDHVVPVQTESKTSLAVSTPRIDAVLERFRKALVDKKVSTTSSPSESPRKSVATITSIDTDTQPPELAHDQEKKSLEDKLAQLEKELLKKRISAAEIELQQLNVDNTVKVKLPGKPECSSVESAKISPPTQYSPPANISPPTQYSHPDVPVKETTVQNKNNNARQKKIKNLVRPALVSKGAINSTDIMYREAVSTTYQQLLKDLDSERLRRNKAEEAASRLAQQMKQVQADASQQSMSMKNCDDTIKNLKKQLVESKERQLQYEEILEKTQAKYKELERQLQKTRNTCTTQENTIKKLEELQDKLENLRTDEANKHSTEIERLEKALAEQNALLQVSQSNVKSQQAELEDMRSLLAAREADHRREIEHRYTIDSPKLEELFQSKIKSLIREHSAEIREYEQQLDKSSKQYRELEDEFRLALQIEANRFEVLKMSYEELSANQSNQEKLIITFKEKDVKAGKLMADLTQLVKEQKDKIQSLSKERQDFSQRYQNLKTKLEKQVQDLNSKVTDLDRLKKDNIELKNQVQGQHSIISGLRKERELWSKELAQQGAALSSERGTLESKIETLIEENKTLRTNLDTETDTIKIKTKLISDLTNTVTSLKKKLSGLESEYNNNEKHLETVKAEYLKELDEERLHTASLEQEVDSLLKRKEELKTKLSETENELITIKESHRNLKAKWQEKSTSISSIEQQVKQMTEEWQAKEKKLIDERDKAVHAADLAVQRLKTADDGFRKQLEAKEVSHSTKVDEVIQQYELKIAEEQHKVEMVEQEMRELLMEKENSKKQFEDRLKKVTQAFTDLQQSL